MPHVFTHVLTGARRWTRYSACRMVVSEHDCYGIPGAKFSSVLPVLRIWLRTTSETLLVEHGAEPEDSNWSKSYRQLTEMSELPSSLPSARFTWNLI